MNLNHHNLPKVSPHPAAAPAGSEIRYPGTTRGPMRRIEHESESH